MKKFLLLLLALCAVVSGLAQPYKQLAKRAEIKKNLIVGDTLFLAGDTLTGSLLGTAADSALFLIDQNGRVRAKQDEESLIFFTESLKQQTFSGKGIAEITPEQFRLRDTITGGTYCRIESDGQLKLYDVNTGTQIANIDTTQFYIKANGPREIFITHTVFEITNFAGIKWIEMGEGLFSILGQNGDSTLYINELDSLTKFFTKDIVIDKFDGISETKNLTVGTDGKVDTISFPNVTGVNWEALESPADIAYQDVAYENGLWAAIANNGGTQGIITSRDGKNWILRNSPDKELRAIDIWNGLVIIVCSGSDGDSVITTSDFINYELHPTPQNNSWYGIDHNDSIVTAVALSGTNPVMWSYDGTEWFSGTAPSASLFDIKHGDSVSVACGNNKIFYSTNGKNFVNSPSSQTGANYKIVNGHEGWAIVRTGTTSDSTIIISDDGINWDRVVGAPDIPLRTMAYGNGKYVAFGSSPEFMYSDDRINWVLDTAPVQRGWRTSIYANGMFHAFSETGTGNRIMKSGNIEEYSGGNGNKLNGAWEVSTQPTEGNGKIIANVEMVKAIAGEATSLNEVYLIDSLGDLPTPVGGVITITQSGVYLFSDTVDFGTNRIELALGVKVTFNAASTFNAMMKFSGDGRSHITGLGENFLSVETLTIQTSGSNDTLINLVDASIDIIRSDLISTGTGNCGVRITGVTGVQTAVINPALLQGFDCGVNITGFVLAKLSPVVFIAAPTSNGTDIFIGPSVIQVIVSEINTVTTDSSSFIRIDSFFTGTIKISDVTNSGTGAFFDPTGINQNSKYVNLKDAGSEFNSNSYVFFHWNQNDSATNVADGIYADIAINPTSININDTIRFFGNDNGKGAFTYTGVNTARLKLEVNLWSNDSPPSENVYRLAVNVNNETLVYASQPYGELHLRSAGDQIRYDYVLDLDPGDVIKLQLAGQGTATNITFEAGQILMRIF